MHALTLHQVLLVLLLMQPNMHPISITAAIQFPHPPPPLR
jgi:hypothetical protein